MKYIFVIIVVAIISYFVYVKFNEQSYKNTWWTGTHQVRLCKVPYYDNSACSVVNATSTDNRITSISVSGSLFNIYDSECFEAGSGSKADGIDRFCRISESGQRYDILPL